MDLTRLNLIHKRCTYISWHLHDGISTTYCQSIFKRRNILAGNVIFQFKFSSEIGQDFERVKICITCINQRNAKIYFWKMLQKNILFLFPRGKGREQCDKIKSPNVYKSCPKMTSLEKLMILTPFQKLPKNVGDLGKLFVTKSFEKLPKVQ